MSTDHQLTELIERYLNGELNEEERLRFEALRRENAAVDSRTVEHQHFTNLLKQYGERVQLEERLNAIHQEIDVHSLTEELTNHPSWVVRMWRHHHSKISVAASVAVFAMMSTLYFTGYFNKSTSNLVELNRKVESYKRTTEKLNNKTNALINDIKSKNRLVNPGSPVGTGFALTSSGYIVTNYHVVKGADSLYVQDDAGAAYRAKLVYTEPAYDIAILKISDASFTNLPAIPYSFKKSKSDLGEEVFTIGFPKDEIVYDRGYLSSATGLNGDTLACQVSIPVNFGNSGGPVLDNQGNVIGIIRGKEDHADGAAFAIRSKYLMKVIQTLPDSLSSKLNLTNKNTLAKLSTTQQVKKLRNYVFMVKGNN